MRTARGQGSEPTDGDRKARAEERPQPGRDGDRHPVRLPARRHADHRADLLAPGLGTYIIQAISDKDIPEIQGVVLVVAVSFVLINLIVDVIYGYLNPKVRLA